MRYGLRQKLCPTSASRVIWEIQEGEWMDYELEILVVLLISHISHRISHQHLGYSYSSAESEDPVSSDGKNKTYFHHIKMRRQWQIRGGFRHQKPSEYR
jgi:hypothetical protein